MLYKTITVQNTPPVESTPTAIPCEGAWDTQWSACSESCGGGTQTQTYRISVPGNTGSGCETFDGDTRSQPCNTQVCPVPCEGAWDTQWSACSESCGGGTQTQTYRISVPETRGPCETFDGDTRSQPCNTQVCPVPCEGAWDTQWSACSESCGGGTQTQTYRISVPGNTGSGCETFDGDTRSQPCNTQVCPVPCEGAWDTQWTACSESCGGGTQTQTYRISVPGNTGSDVKRSTETLAVSLVTHKCVLSLVKGRGLGGPLVAYQAWRWYKNTNIQYFSAWKQFWYIM